MFDIPEAAVRAFERIHGLRVTVHDLQGALWPFLAPDRFQHRSPACQAAKAVDGNASCVAFDIGRVRRDLADLPEGRVHVCPAGLVEWVAPLFGGRGLEQVLFAGVRTPAPGLNAPTAPRRLPLPIADAPPPVGRDESDLILEHLRQLAARLHVWKADAARELAAGAALRPGPGASSSDAVAARRATIARFLHNRHNERVTLGDLAREMGVSESRASHLVREVYGRSFRDLLTEARLHTAAGLLRHSGLPILEVALHSGFDDPAHFHRLFRRKMGMTPGRYRTNAGP